MRSGRKSDDKTAAAEIEVLPETFQSFAPVNADDESYKQSEPISQINDETFEAPETSSLQTWNIFATRNEGQDFDDQQSTWISQVPADGNSPCAGFVDRLIDLVQESQQ